MYSMRKIIIIGITLILVIENENDDDDNNNNNKKYDNGDSHYKVLTLSIFMLVIIMGMFTSELLILYLAP